MNGGQVLLNYARSQGMSLLSIQQKGRGSGGDYLRRVRRSQIKIGKSRIPIPSLISAKKSRA